MYAVVKTGGKQYKVSQGTVLEVEKLIGSKGDAVLLEEVLLVADGDSIKVGQPLVAGAKVSAEIVAQKRTAKVTIFKKIRRQGKQLKKGHRQDVTRIKINEITA